MICVCRVLWLCMCSIAVMRHALALQRSRDLSLSRARRDDVTSSGSPPTPLRPHYIPLYGDGGKKNYLNSASSSSYYSSSFSSPWSSYSRLLQQHLCVATRYTTTTTIQLTEAISSISSDRASCTCTPFSHLPNNHHTVLTSRPTFQSRFIIATSMISSLRRFPPSPPLPPSTAPAAVIIIYLFHKFRRPHMFVYAQHTLCTHTSAIIYIILLALPL